MSDRGKCEACGTCDRAENECRYLEDAEDTPHGCYFWRSREVAEQVLGSLDIPDGAVVVFPFGQASYALRKLSECGGDEDYITAYRTKDHSFVPYFVENLGCCSNDRFELGPFTLWIASHA